MGIFDLLHETMRNRISKAKPLIVCLTLWQKTDSKDGVFGCLPTLGKMIGFLRRSLKNILKFF